jgi:hypothetical protein
MKISRIGEELTRFSHFEVTYTVVHAVYQLVYSQISELHFISVHTLVFSLLVSTLFLHRHQGRLVLRFTLTTHSLMVHQARCDKPSVSVCWVWIEISNVPDVSAEKASKCVGLQTSVWIEIQLNARNWYILLSMYQSFFLSHLITTLISTLLIPWHWRV